MSFYEIGFYRINFKMAGLQIAYSFIGIYLSKTFK